MSEDTTIVLDEELQEIVGDLDEFIADTVWEDAPEHVKINALANRIREGHDARGYPSPIALNDEETEGYRYLATQLVERGFDEEIYHDYYAVIWMLNWEKEPQCQLSNGEVL